MTVATMQTELGTRLKAPNTISSAQSLLWLNQSQDALAIATDPENLELVDTVASVANIRKLYPKYQFQRIISVTDTSNQREVFYTTQSDIEARDPARIWTGTPIYFTYYGLEYVRAQPAVAGTITVVSSSASDTTQKVRIRGISGGVEQTELLSLNGTTVVTGTVSWDVPTNTEPTIFSITKDTTTPTAGYVTATRGAVALAIIAPAAQAEERQPFYLWPTPVDAYNYVIRGYRSPRRMINAEDFPDLPSLYHELVLVGAVIRGHRSLFRFKEAEAVQNQEYTPMLSQFIKEQGDKRASRSPVIRGTAWMNNTNYNQVPWGAVYGDS